ncbi:hypothetical protein OROMI_000918 [Orobanche minor]
MAQQKDSSSHFPLEPTAGNHLTVVTMLGVLLHCPSPTQTMTSKSNELGRNNDCKGGMMEEWHQKLHNNTSPDDVVICQALMDYIKNDFNISVYWKTLNDNGITKELLLSYDRAIHSEPNFRRYQRDGLLCDLGHYMRTLKGQGCGFWACKAIFGIGYTDTCVDSCDGEAYSKKGTKEKICMAYSYYPYPRQILTSLTEKIRDQIAKEMEEQVEKKVQDNIKLMISKLA